MSPAAVLSCAAYELIQQLAELRPEVALRLWTAADEVIDAVEPECDHDIRCAIVCGNGRDAVTLRYRFERVPDEADHHDI